MATQTSKTTRPGYLTDMINNLSNQIKTTGSGEWQNQQNVGLNANQNDALNQLAQSGALHDYASQLMGAGEEGLQGLDETYKQLQAAAGQGISAQDVQNMAKQLYNPTEVEAAINAAKQGREQQLATSTLPEVAQQTMQQSGFGSSNRLATDMAKSGALADIQSEGAQISGEAYQNAMGQAQSILSGNRQNQLSALSGLQQNYQNQAGMLQTGANAAQQAYQNQLSAGNQRQQNAQNDLNTAYNNAIGQQNFGYQNIQNQLGAAGVLNSALGQKTSTTTSGGGSGVLGGMAGGAAAGSAFGPWGALAGAAIGGVSAASQN